MSYNIYWEVGMLWKVYHALVFKKRSLWNEIKTHNLNKTEFKIGFWIACNFLVRGILYTCKLGYSFLVQHSSILQKLVHNRFSLVSLYSLHSVQPDKTGFRTTAGNTLFQYLYSASWNDVHNAPRALTDTAV